MALGGNFFSLVYDIDIIGHQNCSQLKEWVAEYEGGVFESVSHLQVEYDGRGNSNLRVKAYFLGYLRLFYKVIQSYHYIIYTLVVTINIEH